jgi:hypothetical protein
MLYEASCNKQFIPMEELREVFDEGEISTLVKLLRDLRIIVSRKEYIDAIKYARSLLGLPKDDSSLLVTDSLSDDGIIALNPALLDEMRRKNGDAELSYHMVRSFITELLSSLELTATVGSLNDLVKDMSSKYEQRFKISVAKDIVISNACTLSDVEKASLAAAKLVSPARFNSVISILLNRTRKLSDRISLELTEEDVEVYMLRGLKGRTATEPHHSVNHLHT